MSTKGLFTLCKLYKSIGSGFDAEGSATGNRSQLMLLGGLKPDE